MAGHETYDREPVYQELYQRKPGMSERNHKLHYFLDIGALTLGEFVVTETSRQSVQQFETIEEAEAFIAEANGTDVETVRRETTEHARMLTEYRENMIRGSREKAAQRLAENPGNDPDSQQGAQP